jgi:hypothetical protein
VLAYQQALNLFIVKSVEHFAPEPIGKQQQNRPCLLDAQTHPDIVEPERDLVEDVSGLPYSVDQGI